MRISGSPKLASVDITRRSQARASSKPAPRQGPFTMQMVGKGASCTDWMASWSWVMKSLASAGPRSIRNWICMPPVVARPAPVTTAARTAGSHARPANVSRSARMTPGSRRLSGGRSSVTQAQPPRRST